MTALLRGELFKLRTTRTFAALVGTAVGLSLLLVVVATSFETDFALNTLFAGDFTSFFILLLGAIGMTGEWRHRTITSTVLAAPDRLRLLAAKLLSHAAAGVLLSLVVTLAIMLVGTLILSSRGQQTLDAGGLADVLWRNLAIAAVLGPLGVCIGALLRNQVVTVVGVVIVAVALEPQLLSAIPDVGRFGPLFAVPQGILGGAGVEHALAPGAAVAVALAWVAAAFAAAGARLRRGDLV
jgi:ABC-2 type transport system permease protein